MCQATYELYGSEGEVRVADGVVRNRRPRRRGRMTVTVKKEVRAFLSGKKLERTQEGNSRIGFWE